MTSELLINKMKQPGKQILEKEQMLEWIKDNRPELVVMAGAGDIDALVKPVKTILEQ